MSEPSAGPSARPAAPRSPRPARGLFYRVRVGVLLVVLALVLLYAALDYGARRARRSWQAPLDVALVLLLRGPVDETALGALDARLPALEQALAREFARYGGAFTPIHFRRFGPVPEPAPPPRAAPEADLLEPVRLSLGLWRYARRSDAAAGVRDVLGSAFDGKIYVVLSEPRSARLALVEGLGQDGGRIAVARIELSPDSVDFGLFVVAHELFHLLGASDRYGADGQARLPDGLGDPAQEPLYPQRGAEIMARGRVLAPGHEAPPGDLDELRVGAATAREIGWLSAPLP